MKQVRNILIFLLIISSPMLHGCGFTPFYAQGQKFHPRRTSELVTGSSTKADVLQLFGEPLEQNSPDLYKATNWRYYYEYLGVLGVKRAELELTFQDNVLQDYQEKIQRSRY
jgi:outer membrane protein assembly factor BamE (lipoprotein component of BamABCDE complex)